MTAHTGGGVSPTSFIATTCTSLVNNAVLTRPLRNIETADVAINFSVPAAAVANISAAFNAGVPVVSGTTGWLEHYDEMIALCAAKNGGFISSSNFSLGVNLFFGLNEYLAKMMANID